MRILHLDMIGGIAGDMLVAALTHLGAPLEPLQAALDAMEVGPLRVEVHPVSPSGISALRFEVSAPESGHPHRTLTDVKALLQRAGLAPAARARAERIFDRLARAEGRVHGIEPERVTFHEVGALDSIADVVGCALALEHLAPERISASEPLLGHGTVQSRHGPIPVPTPATAELLRQIPTRGLDLEAELTTPTGAAILATEVERFGPWPHMRASAIGYGAGSRELPGRPNLLRAVLGEADPDAVEDEWLIEANIDDMSPELYEHLMDRLFEAGAHDVWLCPVHMKKSRPAMVVSVLGDRSRLETLEITLFTETTTIGLRRHPVERRKLARRIESVQTPWGPVRVKISGEGGRTYTVSPEYEDCRALARKTGVALAEVFRSARAAWRDES